MCVSGVFEYLNKARRRSAPKETSCYYVTLLTDPRAVVGDLLVENLRNAWGGAMRFGCLLERRPSLRCLTA